MATKLTHAPAAVLPLPGFFEKETIPRIGDIWMVPYQERFQQARAWRERHNIPLAVKDTFKVVSIGIDDQITFIHPEGQLPVIGAVGDSQRYCEFLYRNLARITRTVKTLDTHTAWQIFHPTFLVDQAGNAPTPGIPIPDADIQAGKWHVNPEAAYAIFKDSRKLMALEAHLRHYSAELAKTGGQYPLIPWPFHGMLGGIEHALMPCIHEAVFFHNICRGTQNGFEVKGGRPTSEAYSPYGEEVKTGPDGKPIGQKNVEMFKMLNSYDAVIISGQAKSHCVRAFIEDHLNFVLETDPELARKVYLVEDLTSPVVIPGVVDFTEPANAAFDKFRAAGMNVVRSTTPMEEWPGLEGKWD